MAEQILSPNVCRAVAQDFLDHSGKEFAGREEVFSLGTDGRVSIGRDTGEGGAQGTTGMHIADFIGGVAYALADAEKIAIETVNQTTVARVSFELGLLLMPQELGS